MQRESILSNLLIHARGAEGFLGGSKREYLRQRIGCLFAERRKFGIGLKKLLLLLFALKLNLMIDCRVEYEMPEVEPQSGSQYS